MRVASVEVRAELREVPVNAEGVTNAWAAPMVAHARTSFMISKGGGGEKRVYGGKGVCVRWYALLLLSLMCVVRCLGQIDGEDRFSSPDQVQKRGVGSATTPAPVPALTHPSLIG